MSQSLRKHLEQYYKNQKTFTYAFIINQAAQDDQSDWMRDWKTLANIGFIKFHDANILNVIYVLSDTLPIWQFSSTSEAYDYTQCDSAIKSGDILQITSEKVIGVADTWPIAITKEHGELHTPLNGVTAAELQISMNEYKCEGEFNFLPSFKAAAKLADLNHYPVLECFK